MPRTVVSVIKGFGIILFIVVVMHIDQKKLVDALTQASITNILITLALFPVIYTLKSWRWHVLTHTIGLKNPFYRSLQVYYASLFLGAITPGRAGEAAKIFALKADGVPLKKGVTITIADRMIDVLFLGALAIISLYMLFGFSAALFVLIGCVMTGLLFLFISKQKRMLQKIDILQSVTPSTWGLLFFITFLNWVVYFGQIIILAHGFGITVPIMSFIAILVLVGIVSILPVAPAGLGTRDATMLYFLTPYAYSPDRIVAFTFSIFILSMSASLIGAYFWLRLPLTDTPAHATK